MYLSRLEIFGFKSFGRRVKIDFHKGVSAIIGPNGTGKTNIVDAVRWVIGERKIKLLRGGTLDDVIFKGTKTKKALNMAEVTITFSECKGLLSFDPAANQLTITRRAFRDGNSEFFMNGQPVRMKDVRQTLLDLSVSSGVYSIIEQKMMAEILDDDQDNRRMLFEEAADILKFKSDRKATEKKLDGALEEMNRIEDVYSEVKKQVSSLKRQANKAKKYNELKNQINQLSEEIAKSRLANLTSENEAVSKRIQIYQKDEAELRKKKVDLQTKQTQYRENLNTMTKEREEKARKLNLLTAEIGKIEKNIAVWQEKQKHARYEIDNQKNIAQNSKEKLGELQFDEEELEDNIEKARKKIPEIKKQIESIQKESSGMVKALMQFKNKQSQLKKKKEEIERKNWQQLQKLKQLEDNLKQNQEKLSELNSKNKKLQSDLDDRVQSLKISQIENKKANTEYEQTSEKLEKLKESSTEMNDMLGKLIKSQNKLQGRISQISGELEGLESTGDIARDALLKKKDDFGIKGILADFLLPEDQKIAQAMELYLGEQAGYLVCNDAKNAREALDFLYENKYGTAGFFIIGQLDNIKKNISRKPGILYDKVKCKLPQLEVLLYDTYYQRFSDLSDNGLQITGHIISKEGVLYGGYTERGLVTKTLRIRELTKSLEDKKKKLQENKDTEEKLRKNIKQNKIDREKTGIELKVLEKKLHNDNIEIGNKKIEVERVKQNIDSVDQSSVSLNNQISQIVEKIEEFDIDEKNVDDIDKEIDRLDNIISEKSRTQREKEQTQQNKNLEKVRLTENIKRMESDLSRIAMSISEQRKLIEKAEEGQAEAIEVNRESEKKISEFKESLQDAYHKKTSNEDNLNEVSAGEQRLNQLIEENIKKERDVSNRLENIEEQIHQLRTKSARLESDIDNIYENNHQLKDIDLQNVEILDDEAISGKLEIRAKHQKKIEELAPINFEAEDEYQAAKERFEFFKKQKDDVDESIRILKKSIKELNNRARKMFMETFEVARENFKRLFVELFGGGFADAILVDKDGNTENIDVLEAEIKLLTQPPEKKLLAITQLSLGEKSLAAIALLFGLYLQRPSPFCLLDEVDAPLDDSNLGRYLNKIRQFETNTQFILITHNKRTMQTVDYLYGTSMEDGVTQIFSAKMDELTEKYERSPGQAQ
ncbi:MAG: chromosome segregation protein SMC [Candidatus Zixiibacteriota bacterium]